MKEKVVELLIFIMSEMQENKRLNEIDVSDLRNQGYTPTEISAAFSWLFDIMPSGGADHARGIAGRRGSRRVLHEAEKLVLSLESQGYLIQLAELGLLDEKEMESVIERAMVAGYEQLSVMEVQEIVAAVLLAREGGTGGGNRFLLNSGDTIH